MKPGYFAIGLCLIPLAAAAAPAATPYADNNGALPPSNQYNGPLFKLSHAYPAKVAAPAMPWRDAIQNGPITVQNASVYAQALKAAVGKDMQTLLFDYAHWNAAARGWYNEPWLGSANGDYGGREAIHGMYVGSNPLDASLFAASGLTKPITTYVLTYYDKVAAQTLNHVWTAGAGMKPAVTPTTTQFAEGSLIIKAAFITAGPDVWPVMAGTQAWPAYITTNATSGDTTVPKVTNTYLMQFDIIVKDSQSAPDTGWVFTTLVYDRNVKPGANGIWDQMVVLGAQWGNDPQANSTLNPSAPLLQTWNNPAAPAYGSATLGWGNRLSGPNDGAMNDIAYQDGGSLKKVTNAQDSSCMSCHSTAQWNWKTNASPSFLLPATPYDKKPAPQFIDKGHLVSPPPGSADWLRWFQNRKGNVPMDAGSIAGDFDMVLTFKSLPLWFSATTHRPNVLNGLDLRGKPVKK
jgi:hypothetical protein